MSAPKACRDLSFCWGADRRVPDKLDLDDYDRQCMKRKVPSFWIKKKGKVYSLYVEANGRVNALGNDAAEAVAMRLRNELAGLVIQRWILLRRPWPVYAGRGGFYASSTKLSRLQYVAKVVFGIYKDAGLCTEEDYR